MDEDFDRIGNALHPAPYPQVIKGIEGIPLLLVRRSWFGAKYALAVVPYADEPVAAQLGRIRRAVDAATDASFFAGCELLVLWIGPEGKWASQRERVGPDVHGARSTIVQGLYWLDPTTGHFDFKRTSWGPMKFGNLQGQISALQKLLTTWTEPPAAVEH